jgi:hypothetical protein
MAGAAALALAGCGTNVEPGFVAKQWAGEMRELQINPVFPPREDFQVGDVYLPAVRPEDAEAKIAEKGYMPMAVWLMEAGGPSGAAARMNTFYQARSTYPPTPQTTVTALQQSHGPDRPQQGQPPAAGTGGGTGGGGTGDRAPLSGPIPQPGLDCSTLTDPATCNIFTGDEKTKLRRMRIVGFPTFLATTITQGNLSAFVPIEAFSAALGLDFGDVEAVSVNIPVAESIGLPAVTVLGMTRKNLNDNKTALCGGESAAEGIGAIGALLPAGQRTDKGGVPPRVHLIAVSEVFYTRAIEISIKTQQSFGLGARVQANAPGLGGGTSASATPQGQNQGGTPDSGRSLETSQAPENGQATDGSNVGGNTAGGGTSSTGGGGNEGLPGAIERLQQLKQATANLPSAPGGNLQILSVADGHVGMRRLFDRPIAIGYRGLSLEVDSRTCEVTGGGAADERGVLGEEAGAKLEAFHRPEPDEGESR